MNPLKNKKLHITHLIKFQSVPHSKHTPSRL